MTVVRFAVLKVTCRHCGEEITVELPDGLSPDEQLAECERQSDATHRCEKRKAAEAGDAACGKTLECGGACTLASGHPPPCLCAGDEDGVPGTCPA